MAYKTQMLKPRQTELQMGARVNVHDKPRWVKSSHAKDMIQFYAKVRSMWFVMYSFGGGYWHGGDTLDGHKTRFSGEPEWCTQEECAEQIVIYSKWMLVKMKQIGRTPIAGDNTHIRSGWTPTCDLEWEGRMKQRYSLYLTLDELYNATAGMVAGREINDAQIKIKELTDG